MALQNRIINALWVSVGNFKPSNYSLLGMQQFSKIHKSVSTMTGLRCHLPGYIPVLFIMGATLFTGCGGQNVLGDFEGWTAIGEPQSDGNIQFDARSGEYRVTGGGSNIWDEADSFHFAWRQMVGDLALEADVTWEDTGGHEHRKAGWMVRGGLEPDDPYTDAVVHGNGLITLQYRQEKGGATQEVKSPISAPATIMLERHGDQFTLSVSKDDDVYQPVATVTVALQDTVFAGLAVTSHDDAKEETAIFSSINSISYGTPPDDDRVVESTLEIINIETGERRIIYRVKDHFEAPNWSRDGKSLLFNSHGSLFTIPVSGGIPEKLDTGTADRCNNDHGYSPDGTQIAISHSPENQSLIYVLPSSGGEPRLVTKTGPSYWHGWSPDGKTLTYCASRNGEYDVYTIPVEGGAERRLTDAVGLDDGPEYSPDGKYIFFNSVRTGQMKIWRMRADGSEQVQITPDDEYGDWFPHPSPDGKWIIFLSYDKSVEGHPANKDVVLRLMPMEEREPYVIATLFGGQGTINVPSWSPDSKEVAFVSYRLVAP